MAKEYRFVVQGVLAFPLDMLRYDACYPTTSDSVCEIVESGDRQSRRAYMEANKQFKVELFSLRKPTNARWSSFGWTVMSVR